MKNNMGKKTRLRDIKTGKIIIVDEDTCFTTTYAEMVKSGIFGKEKQYKYFCEHPEEIEDQETFKKLEKEYLEKPNNN